LAVLVRLLARQAAAEVQRAYGVDTTAQITRHPPTFSGG
jgi:hypothetical protein